MRKNKQTRILMIKANCAKGDKEELDMKQNKGDNALSTRPHLPHTIVCEREKLKLFSAPKRQQ